MLHYGGALGDGTDEVGVNCSARYNVSFVKVARSGIGTEFGEAEDPSQLQPVFEKRWRTARSTFQPESGGIFAGKFAAAIWAKRGSKLAFNMSDLDGARFFWIPP